MNPIRLESIDPQKNRARFYVLYVSKRRASARA